MQTNEQNVACSEARPHVWENGQEQANVKVACQHCSNMVSLDRSLLFFSYSQYKQLDRTCHSDEEKLDKAYKKYGEFLTLTKRWRKDNNNNSTNKKKNIDKKASTNDLTKAAKLSQPRPLPPAPRHPPPLPLSQQKHFPTMFPKLDKDISDSNRTRSFSLLKNAPGQVRKKRTLSNSSEILPEEDLNSASTEQFTDHQTQQQQQQSPETNDTSTSPQAHEEEEEEEEKPAASDGRMPEKERSTARSRRLRGHRNVKIIMKNGTFVVAQQGSEQVLSDTVTSVLSSVGVGKGTTTTTATSATQTSLVPVFASTPTAESPTPMDIMGRPQSGMYDAFQCGSPFQQPQRTHNADDDRMDRLFTRLEQDTSAHHPFCASCTHKEISTLDTAIKLYQAKIRTYKSYIETAEVGIPEADIDKAIEACAIEEQSLLEQINAVKRRKLQLEPKKTALHNGKKRLSEMEAKYWAMHGKHLMTLAHAHDVIFSLFTQVPLARARMSELSHTYILDDAFPIRPAGHFATINGFRFGRFQNIPVPWPEVNCACGYAALLLQAAAKVLRIDAVTRSIIPMGSTPKVIVKGSVLPLDLFYEGKMFSAKKFDEALTALLTLTAAATSQCLAADPAFATSVPLPYKIENDIIGNISIRSQAAKSDHKWACAMKNLLTDIKWLVLWLAAHTV